MLDYYTAVAEKETGFWVGLPVATGQMVSRAEWLCLMNDDPDHFQLVTLTEEDLTGYSLAVEDAVERAVFVTWSDEELH
ncbi:hypothetical protein ACHAC9_22410 [Massilia sp. CMS3.1]|uniref:hypothetical protein n=1 Tax=Massilia sp. CMS3.1 TaxID=3373083 RepID=UPI003EE6236A